MLEAARDLAEVGGARSGRRMRIGGARPNGAGARDLARALHHRIQIEQSAVAECMRLAQKSRDELTRSVFRQIAADSLRHAEIVASIQTYLDRGLNHSIASGVVREDIVRLIAREREAEAKGPVDVEAQLGGIMSVLWESMEADERKHQALLDRMLSTGFPITKNRETRSRRVAGCGSGARSPRKSDGPNAVTVGTGHGHATRGTASGRAYGRIRSRERNRTFASVATPASTNSFRTPCATRTPPAISGHAAR